MCVFIIIPIGHFYGRKPTMTILSVSTFISSAIIFVSKTAIHIFISQLFNGFTVAAQISIVLLLMSEYTSPKYRGVFLTIKSATYFWGIWVANAIGIFTHYKYIGIVGMVFSGISFIISLIIPESPYWLAFKGRYDECSVAHRWLKGVNEDAEEELDVLIKSQKESTKSEASNKSVRQKIQKYVAAIKQPDIIKPLLTCFLIFSMYHASGKLVCAVYAIEMMKKLTGSQSTVYSGVLILDGFTVLGMYVGCGLSKILKRRTLLLTTSIIGTTFLFAMSIYLYLVNFSFIQENPYVILTMLIGYSVAICCGPIILSSSISAELLPIRFRSFCVCIFSVYCTILLGTVVKVSPYVFNSVGFQGAYLGFGIWSTITIILIFKYVPETKDKTLLEIAAIFKEREPDVETQLKLLPSNINK